MAVAILPLAAKLPHVILPFRGKIVLTAISDFAASAKLTLTLILIQTLTLTQTLTLIPTLALTLTQTEEKHYFASGGKIATSFSFLIELVTIVMFLLT